MHQYHFYLLGERGEILGVVDRGFADDEAALKHARTLLPRCISVDLLRGALVLGLVERDPFDPQMDAPRKPGRRWWFTPSRAQKWRVDENALAGI